MEWPGVPSGAMARSGMDRRADPAHVAHVGRAGVRVVALVRDAVGRHVGPEPLGQDRVVAHRPWPGRRTSPRRSCRWPARPPRTVTRKRSRIGLVVGLVVAPDHEPGRRPVRDDVRRRAALADDAVDPGGRAELLAPQADRGEQQDHRVEGVLAAPRIGRGVRLEAREDDVDVLRRERPALDVRCGRTGGTAVPRRGRRTGRRRS